MAGSLFLRRMHNSYLDKKQVVFYFHLDRETDHAPTWDELADEFGGSGTV